jgi:hypothetical protein
MCAAPETENVAVDCNTGSDCDRGCDFDCGYENCDYESSGEGR